MTGAARENLTRIRPVFTVQLLGHMYALLDDDGHAMSYLERACDERNPWLLNVPWFLREAGFNVLLEVVKVDDRSLRDPDGIVFPLWFPTPRHPGTPTVT